MVFLVLLFLIFDNKQYVTLVRFTCNIHFVAVPLHIHCFLFVEVVQSWSELITSFKLLV